MRMIPAQTITDTVANLCRKAAVHLGEGVESAIHAAFAMETVPLARMALDTSIRNAEIARQTALPLCQDTGMAVVFADVGQDIFIQGGFEDAIQEGVRQGYKSLRASVLTPLTRRNTGDNTPAVIHTRLVPGDRLHITVAPKGFGSENMSRLAMLQPADGEQGVVDFVYEAVRIAGGNPCPPLIVGVGIGGTMEQCCLLAKRALLRPVGEVNGDADLAALEQRLLETVNRTGIGAQGWGGVVTALAVHVLTYPTHIAGLPVAVNLQCHVARHEEAVL